MPRAYALSNMNTNAFSAHVMGGSWGFEAFLFLITAVFATGLMVGYRTRLCTFMTWLLLCSMHNRNLFLLNAGDRFFALCLFWCLFLPLGACYSVDSRQKSRLLPHPQVSSMGTFGYLMQIIFFYSFAGFLKTDPVWTTNGTGIYYALNVEQFGTPLAHTLLQFPALTHFLTFATLWVERFGPLLILSPFWTIQARLAALMALGLFHICLLFVMSLQFFHWICLASLIALIPSALLDKILGPFPPEQFNQKKEYMPLVLSLLGAFFIVYIFFWNMDGLENSKYKMPKQMIWVGYLFNINQHWGMYAPKPMTDDGWYVFPGKLRNGNIVDANTEKPVAWRQPASLVDYGEDHRWILFHLYIWDQSNALFRVPYARYLCREWNTHHPLNQELLGLDMTYMEKDTQPNYQKPLIHPVVILSYDCVKQRQTRSPFLNKKEIPSP